MALNKLSQYPERGSMNPTPRIEQINLVSVTADNQDVLTPLADIVPTIAFNSLEGDIRPMTSGDVWNEQEQIREAFTVGPSFTLPHFRYVADDYFWKSIVKDKAFYYLEAMDLVTWPLAWTQGTANAALHLEWLRAPEQTHIFKFIDGTASTSRGSIILQNRTKEMVEEDKEEIHLNRVSTSTSLKEVNVLVKSKDSSNLYVNFPGAKVNFSLLNATTTDNIMLTPDATSNVVWKSLQVATPATTISNCFNIDGSNFCRNTVTLIAPKATTITDSFQNNITGEGDYSADIRLTLPSWEGDLTFGVNADDNSRGIALHPAAVKHLFENLNTNLAEKHVVTVGIDLRAFTGELSVSITDVETAAAALVTSGKWTINYVPINYKTGDTLTSQEQADLIWSRAKAGEFNGTNLNLDIGDVVLRYGRATLPGSSTLPQTIRFASDKASLDSAFKSNTSVKTISEWYVPNVTSMASFAQDSYIERINPGNGFDSNIILKAITLTDAFNGTKLVGKIKLHNTPQTGQPGTTRCLRATNITYADISFIYPIVANNNLDKPGMYIISNNPLLEKLVINWKIDSQPYARIGYYIHNNINLKKIIVNNNSPTLGYIFDAIFANNSKLEIFDLTKATFNKLTNAFNRAADLLSNCNRLHTLKQTNLNNLIEGYWTNGAGLNSDCFNSFVNQSILSLESVKSLLNKFTIRKPANFTKGTKLGIGIGRCQLNLAPDEDGDMMIVYQDSNPTYLKLDGTVTANKAEAALQPYITDDITGLAESEYGFPYTINGVTYYAIGELLTTLNRVADLGWDLTVLYN